ncbi:outer membrane beta-barrel protein [Massilia horti]|uniref:Outer membrane protein beta-barrel domain-containing protein n=1 Tax=Massilia horti TaxID=2562153 RepID=A0A4Y9T5X9_9BURK|nr:outer membrane beta-barrel protein [Massilia horti]TFW32698.1 hypothetical protein E4O92_09110 [Massilia horti]
MRKLVLALVTSAAGITAVHAQTRPQDFPRGYLGLGGAVAGTAYNIKGIGNVNKIDKTVTSIKVFGGYEFDPIWGVEAGYDNFSRTNFDFTTGNFQAGTGNSDGYGVYFASKGRYPINDQWEAYVKLGVAFSHRRTSTSVGLNFKEDDTGPYGGAGLQWSFYPRWDFILEYERFGKNKPNGAQADVFSFGTRYSF